MIALGQYTFTKLTSTNVTVCSFVEYCFIDDLGFESVCMFSIDLYFCQ